MAKLVIKGNTVVVKSDTSGSNSGSNLSRQDTVVARKSSTPRVKSGRIVPVKRPEKRKDKAHSLSKLFSVGKSFLRAIYFKTLRRLRLHQSRKEWPESLMMPLTPYAIKELKKIHGYRKTNVRIISMDTAPYLRNFYGPDKEWWDIPTFVSDEEEEKLSVEVDTALLPFERDTDGGYTDPWASLNHPQRIVVGEKDCMMPVWACEGFMNAPQSPED